MKDKIAGFIMAVIVVLYGTVTLAYFSLELLDFTPSSYEFWVTTMPLSGLWGYIIGRNWIK